jgi:hypothetical protein
MIFDARTASNELVYAPDASLSAGGESGRCYVLIWSLSFSGSLFQERKRKTKLLALRGNIFVDKLLHTTLMWPRQCRAE